MHIRELQLLGFKSFADKTTLRFSEGMNAVIGPNGCGKTNVLDALRWVLGEQSFTLLRCAKNEDLVFSGTSDLPATNYAEVKLLLANDGLPRYGSEIEIRRRYFRSGESEYYLNRQPCRLKDVQEVFLASGIGTKAYSIFDLRQMREIIAGNIRKMFEEAATLAKYRDAKADCLRKLELTDKDLTRLDDIIAERERVVRSLRRQAGKLKAYERLKEEEKGLRLIELKAEFESLSREFELIDKDTNSMEQAEADRLVEIRRLEQELHQHRGRLREEQTRKDSLVQEARDMRRRLTEMEGDRLLGEQRARLLTEDAGQKDSEREAMAKEVADLEQVFARSVEKLGEANEAQAKAEAELESAREASRSEEHRLFELRRQEQTLRESLESVLEEQHEAGQAVARLEAGEQNRAETQTRLTTEREEIRSRKARVQSDIESAGKAVADAAAALSGARDEVERGRAELERAVGELRDTGEELGRARERRAAQERELAVLDSSRSDRLARGRELLGDRLVGELGRTLEIEEGWEPACEAALQPLVDLIVTRGIPDLAAVRALIDAGLVTGYGLVPAGGDPGRAPEPPTGVEVAGRLAEHVTTGADTPGCVRGLLERFFVVGSEAELLRAGAGDDLVTRGGCARFGDGRLVVAPRGPGRLSFENLFQDRKAQAAESGKTVERLTARREELRSAVERLQSGLEEKKELVVELERRKSSSEAVLRSLGAQADELARDERRLRDELGAVRRPGAGGEIDSARERAGQATARAAEQAEALKRAQAAVSAQEEVARKALDRSGELLARLSEARQLSSRLETESAYAKRSVEERRRRMADLEKAAAEGRRRAGELEGEAREGAPRVEELRQEIEKLEGRIDELRVADLAKVEEELEGNLDGLRREREQNQSLLMEQRIRRHELNQRQAAVIQEAREEFDTDIAQFRPEATADAVERLASVRRRLESLGRVNPLARDEYEQEHGDLERLVTQRGDIVAARGNLTSTMEEIDRHARERFLETYQEVRAAFRDVFRQLFVDGEADLALVDETNPLESEIAITARPKGKNPKRLEQLSDGEKALLAVSLLFAFYRVKPAPFCFLDEIDAPLDDANVGRFADYLKDISRNTQVIIITHNRLTVERAEVLFGVTAERPGVSKLVSVSLAEYQSSPVASSVH